MAIYFAAILYVMGGFLYHLHQYTVLYLTEEENFSRVKVTVNSIIWPIHVFETMLTFALASLYDNDEEDDSK
jgi:hypothetical protein